MTKKCTVCKIEKPLEDFNKNSSKSDGKQSHCRDCNRKKSRDYYKRNPEKHKKNVNIRNQKVRRDLQKFVYDYLLAHPCDCGESDPAALDFDHIDPSEKVLSISKAISNYWPLEKLKQEIEKCTVMCANCHRKRTAKQFGWYSFIVSPYDATG